MFHPAIEGGELILRKQVKEVKLPLSKQGDWCFLFGDSEHEILPVTSGTRVALTYRVYSTKLKDDERTLYIETCTYSDVEKIREIFTC